MLSRREIWKRLFVCPCCHGEGGDYDPVLFYGVGGGPWEDCYLCKGSGRVGLWRLLLWRKWQMKSSRTGGER
jgi:hypothetical protein